MKNIILILLLTCHGMVFANPYEWQITRIIDGDTIAVAAPWLPAPLKKELSVRVYGVDTPEKGFRAKCVKENEQGIAATQFTKKLLDNSNKRLIVVREWDKYGGRILGDVLVDGKSLRDLLISNGFAREYYGEAKKSWCD